MREQSKPVTIVGLQPEEGSSIPGIRRWPAEYLPGIFNASLVDEVLDIHQRDAENTMRELAVREGIFCGVSSGGAVAGALRVAKANPGAVVVAIICDRAIATFPPGCLGKSILARGRGFKIIAQAPFYPSAQLAHVKRLCVLIALTGDLHNIRLPGNR